MRNSRINRRRQGDIVPFTLTAHRGAPTVAPENTVAAFTAAIEQGADELELDIQATSDQQLVVIHDQAVDRTTSGTGSVSEFTLAELRQLDVPHHDGSIHRIPTFREILEAVGDFPLQVELKAPGAVPLLAKLLTDEPHRIDQFWVNTGDVEMLQQMHTLCPQARLAHSVDHASIALVDVAIALNAQAVYLAWPGLDQSVVDHAHGRDLLITSWLANEPADVYRGFELGLDGLTTDDVPRVLPHVRACLDARQAGRPLPTPPPA